jgi:hypothetical protein
MDEPRDKQKDEGLRQDERGQIQPANKDQAQKTGATPQSPGQPAKGE